MKELLDHITDYRSKWSEGSVIIDNLNICLFTSIFSFFLMGVFPIFFPSSHLNLINWGFLGISGATLAILRSQYKSDLVEVGNTEGQKELRRAKVGTPIGFFSGIIMYSMFAGGIANPGGILPNPLKTDDINNFLSIFWAISSGFSFETIFEQLKSAVQGVKLPR